MSSSKADKHSKAPFDLLPMPSCRFDDVHFGLVGPLPPSHGFTYILTTMDCTTQWPEVVPLVSTKHLQWWLRHFLLT